MTQTSSQGNSIHVFLIIRDYIEPAPLFFRDLLLVPDRFCLNFERLPYRTEWVEYPDIEGHCKKLGIPPTSDGAAGWGAYTLPAIHDATTGAFVSESFAIAEYLEKTYPDSPTVFPHNTRGLQTNFDQAFFKTALSAIPDMFLPVVCLKLNPSSQDYFRRTREKTFFGGVSLEDAVPKGTDAVVKWAKFKEALNKADSWYAASGGPFVMGAAVSWADLDVAAWLVSLKIVWGEDSAQWKDVASWNGGRWKDRLDSVKEYQIVV